MTVRALVTGAAQGIGASVAARFVADGISVVGLDRQEFDLPGGEVVTADLSGNVEGLFDVLESNHGPIDILVNCAGICPTEPLVDSEIETWTKVFRVNVFAPFFLSQSASVAMASRGKGCILNLASISGFLGKPEQTAYGASKAALISVTRSLALVFGPQGVRVNAIAPGVIATPLTQSIAEMRSEIRGVSPEETLATVIQSTALRRIGQPDEIAELASFLCSDRAAFITGQTYVVDGGFLLR